jgi:hypothetical protein
MNAFLHEWCDLATQSGIRQMMQLAKTLLSHKSGILSWWTQRISNGRMEGINNKIKSILSRAFPWRASVHWTVTQSKARQGQTPAPRIRVHLCSSVVHFCRDAA